MGTCRKKSKCLRENLPVRRYMSGSVYIIVVTFYNLAQCADGESNKIVYDKKKTVTE